MRFVVRVWNFCCDGEQERVFVADDLYVERIIDVVGRYILPITLRAYTL